MRLDRDQAFRLQCAQRLAQRAAADAQLLAKLLFAQAFAALHAAFHDGRTQVFLHARERRVAGFSKIALLGLGMAVSEDPRGTIAGRAEQRNQAAAAM